MQFLSVSFFFIRRLSEDIYDVIETTLGSAECTSNIGQGTFYFVTWSTSFLPCYCLNSNID